MVARSLGKQKPTPTNQRLWKQGCLAQNIVLLFVLCRFHASALAVPSKRSADNKAPQALLAAPQTPEALHDPWVTFIRNPACKRRRGSQCVGSDDYARVNAWCPELKLAYLKNPKANSKNIKDAIISMCSEPTLPEDFFAYMRVPEDQSPFSFTFVKDPLSRAIAAYAEVDSHCDALERDPARDPAALKATSFMHMKRGQEPQRFHAFLRDWSNNSIPAACEPDHAVRQFDVVCPAFSSMGGIGTVENYEQDLRRLLRTAGVPASKLALLPRAPANKYENVLFAETKAQNKADVMLHKTRETHRLVCELYAIDYDCFGYERPADCAGM